MERGKSLRTTQETTAFEAFFRAHFVPMARAAGLVVGDFSTGEEIAQEAFARLYGRWDSLQSEGHARNFGFKVALNLARSHLRRRARHGRPAGRASEVMWPDHERATESRLVIRDALAGLSPRQRASVVLVDYVGLDAVTAARVLGLRASTIRVHLARGRKTLGARLDPEELRR
jgi:RNA polymerase sigma factor (sigma-70 family)